MTPEAAFNLLQLADPGADYSALSEQEAIAEAYQIAEFAIASLREGERPLYLDSVVAGELSDRQRMQYLSNEAIVEQHGKFNKGIGPDGAHYVPADKNPFKGEGLICGNCPHYGDGNKCEIVAGKIEAEAICKLWVIPASKLAKERQDAPVVKWKGLSIGVTHEPGQYRFPGGLPMRSSYGRIYRSYGKAEDGKALDVYLSPAFDPAQDYSVYRITQRDPQTGLMDESKYGIGYSSPSEFVDDFCYHAGRDRFGCVQEAVPSELDVYRQDEAEKKHEEVAIAPPPNLDADRPAPEEEDLVDVIVKQMEKATASTIKNWTDALRKWFDTQDSLESARDALQKPQNILPKLNGQKFRRQITEWMTIADFAGREEVLDEAERFDSLSDRLDAKTPSWLKMPFDEAIAYFRSKINISNQEYFKTRDGYADWAFWVSGLTRNDLIEDARWLVDKAIADGTDFETFKRQWNRSIGRKAGWFPGERRLYIIYDTNVRSAYGTGRGKQMMDPDVKARRPFIIWRHRDSPNPRVNHKALDNKAIAADSPFWQKVRSPAGFGCFTPDTLVCTPSGPRRIDSLRVGDHVIGGSGHINTVSAEHSTSYEGELIRIVTKDRDGSLFVVTATPDHRFLGSDGWVEAKFLRSGDELLKTALTPVTESLLQDVCVQNVDHKDPRSCDNGVPVPASSAGATTDAFNSEVQFWNENVNPEAFPLALNVVVVNNAKTTRLQIPYHLAFRSGRLCVGVRVAGRILSVPSDLHFESPFSNIRPEKRAAASKFFSNSPSAFASVFGFPQSRMVTPLLPPCPSARENLLDPLLSGRIPLPLHSDGIAPPPSQSIEVQKAHHGSVVDAPDLAQVPRDHLFLDISLLKGFFDGNFFDLLDSSDNSLLHPAFVFDIGTDDWDVVLDEKLPNGAVVGIQSTGDRSDGHSLLKVHRGQGGLDRSPFNFFNSLDNLVNWCRAHDAIISVVDVEVLPSSSINVLDLSVFPDQSYNLVSGVVHNCRCGTFSASEDYCKRNGIEILSNPPDPETIAEPGFRYPLQGLDEQSRQQQIDEMMSRVTPEVRKQIEKERS